MSTANQGPDIPETELQRLQRILSNVQKEREEQTNQNNDAGFNLTDDFDDDFDFVRISNPTLAALGIHDNPVNPAVLLSLTIDGQTRPIIQLDERQWTIESFVRQENDVIVTKRTYGVRGYYSKGLGPNPSTIDLVLQYAPVGTTGTQHSWDIRGWQRPLIQLARARGLNCELRIGGLNYGIWIMRSPKYEHLNLLRIPRREDIVVVPRIVRANFQFSSVHEDIHFDSPITPDEYVQTGFIN